MIQTDDDSTRARVLDLIAEKGPVSAAQLAKILSLTPAAVRRHITALEGSGEIVVHTPAGTGKRGRGRPARHYVATPEARTTFAEGYSDIAKRALGYLQQVAGDKAIDSFAAVRDVGDGTFAVQLCQGHCPVRDVAGQFTELCDAETQAFARLIGVPVQRLATLAGGDHVCTTHVPIAMPALRKRAVRAAAAHTRRARAQRTEGTR